MDDLLEDVTLRDVKVQFWKRYKLKYPVEVTHRISWHPAATENGETSPSRLRHMESQNVEASSYVHQEEEASGTDLYMYEDKAEVKPDAYGGEKYWQCCTLTFWH